MKPGFMICQASEFRMIAGFLKAWFLFCFGWCIRIHRVLAGIAAWASDPARELIGSLAGSVRVRTLAILWETAPLLGLRLFCFRCFFWPDVLNPAAMRLLAGFT